MFDVNGALGTWVTSTVVLVVGSLMSWGLVQAARFLSTRVSVERMNELHGAAIWVVRYVEQEWQSGRLAKDMRLDEAMAKLQERVPWVTPALAKQAIEAAVRTLKEVVGADAPVPQALKR